VNALLGEALQKNPMVERVAEFKEARTHFDNIHDVKKVLMQFWGQPGQEEVNKVVRS
jgi:hypothetical protein